MEYSSDPDRLNQVSSLEEQAELAGLAERLLNTSYETQTYTHYKHDYIAKLGGEVIGIVRLQGGHNSEEEDVNAAVIFTTPNYDDNFDEKYFTIKYFPNGSLAFKPGPVRGALDKAYLLATRVQDSLKQPSAEDSLFHEILRLLNQEQFGVQTGYQTSVKLEGDDEDKPINQLISEIIKNYTDDEVVSRNIITTNEVDDTDLYVGTYEPSNPLHIDVPYMEIERVLSDGSRIQFKFDYDGNYARHIAAGEHEDEFEYEEPTIWQLQLVYEAIEDKLRAIGEVPPIHQESEQVGEAPFRQAVKDTVEKFKIYDKIPDADYVKKQAAWKEYADLMAPLEADFRERYQLVKTEKDGRPLELNLFVSTNTDGGDPGSHHGQFNKMAVNSPLFYLDTERGAAEIHMDSGSKVRLEFCDMAPSGFKIGEHDEPHYDIFLTGLVWAEGRNIQVLFPMSTMTVVEYAHLLN